MVRRFFLPILFHRRSALKVGASLEITESLLALPNYVPVCDALPTKYKYLNLPSPDYYYRHLQLPHTLRHHSYLN